MRVVKGGNHIDMRSIHLRRKFQTALSARGTSEHVGPKINECLFHRKEILSLGKKREKTP